MSESAEIDNNIMFYMLYSGTCETKKLFMTHSRTAMWGKTGEIEECLCENGEYIYYHTHTAWIS